METTAVMRETAVMLPRLGRDGWLVLLAVTIGTNALDFLTLPPPGTKPGLAFVIAAAIRVALVFWIGFGVQRRLLGATPAFRITRAFWAFALLQIAFTIGMGATNYLVGRLLGPPADLATQWLTGFAALGLWCLVAIRLLAWNAAVALGAGPAWLRALWGRQRGDDFAIMAGLVGLVLPVAAIHLALTLTAVKLPMAPASHLTIAAIDGIVSAMQLALTAALGAVALRLAEAVRSR